MHTQSLAISIDQKARNRTDSEKLFGVLVISWEACALSSWFFPGIKIRINMKINHNILSSLLKKRGDRSRFFVAVVTLGYENAEWKFEYIHFPWVFRQSWGVRRAFFLSILSQWTFQLSLLNQTAGLMEAPLPSLFWFPLWPHIFLYTQTLIVGREPGDNQSSSIYLW